MFRLTFALGLLVLTSTAVQAQTYRPSTGRGKVYRMEILNGSLQTVRYFGTDLTPNETSTLRDLERLENEGTYARNLLALKQEYVNSENLLEPFRRSVQFKLYGVNATLNDSFGLASGYGYGYPGRLGVPAFGSYLGYNFPSVGVTASASRSVNQSLANGMGDEGTVKNAVAQMIAQQATPEYAANIEKEYDRIAMRATASPALRLALNIPSINDTRRVRSNMAAAAADVESSAPVVLTLATGQKLYGQSMKEDKDWITLQRRDGSKVRVRPSEVSRIDETPKDRIRFSAD